MFNFKSIKNIVFNSIKAFLVSLFFGSAANAHVNDLEPVKILFIGNSYTHMNDMPKTLQKMSDADGRSVIVEHNTLSGGSFKVHSGRNDMYEAINKRKWDYVILQGYSRELSFPSSHIDTASVPYIDTIVNAIYANSPCSQVLFYMTWGYEDGYKDRPETDTYEKMADSIANGYRYVGELYDVPVVPVGMVWKTVKAKNEMDLYAPDRAHPSKYGSYLIANTFYQAIFNSSKKKIYNSKLDKKNAILINKTVKEYLDDNFSFEGQRHDLFSIEEKENFSIDFKVAENVSTVTWYFEDGTSTTLRSGQHTFGKKGKHTVRIEVLTDCGNESHERIVQFRKPRGKMRRRRESED